MKFSRVLAVLSLGAAFGSAHAVIYSLGSFNQNVTGGAVTSSPASPALYVAETSRVITPSSLGAGGYAELRIRADVNSLAANPASVANFINFGFGRLDIAQLSASSAALGATGGAVSGMSNYGAPLMYYRDTTSGTKTEFNKQRRLNNFSDSGFDTGKVTATPKDNSGQSATYVGAKVDLRVRVLSNGTFTCKLYHYDQDGNLLTASNLFPATSGQLVNPQTVSGTINFGGTNQLSANTAFTPILRYDSGYALAAGWAVNFTNAELEVVPEPGTIAALGLGAAVLLRRRRK